jgi:regulator of nucleoside diphosphate kinase
MDALIIAGPDYVKLRALRPTEALEQELERAIVMSANAIPPGVITMNSRVLCVDETTGERRSVRIVYRAAADASVGRDSVPAAVNAALLGLSIGQATEWKFLDSRRRRVEEVIERPALGLIYEESTS